MSSLSLFPFALSAALCIASLVSECVRARDDFSGSRSCLNLIYSGGKSLKKKKRIKLEARGRNRTCLRTNLRARQQQQQLVPAVRLVFFFFFLESVCVCCCCCSIANFYSHIPPPRARDRSYRGARKKGRKEVGVGNEAVIQSCSRSRIR